MVKVWPTKILRNFFQPPSNFWLLKYELSNAAHWHFAAGCAAVKSWETYDFQVPKLRWRTNTRPGILHPHDQFKSFQEYQEHRELRNIVKNNSISTMKYMLILWFRCLRIYTEQSICFRFHSECCSSIICFVLNQINGNHTDGAT